MLPILRVIPVGGVLLAIAILVLALNPPAGLHVLVMAPVTPPRGALIARDEHPEWRQFLILAALRRADELNKLRDLPDTPTRTAPVIPTAVAEPVKPVPDKKPDTAELAGVQLNRAVEDDVTGSVEAPAAAIPVDIGEASSTELPIVPHKEQPPVVMMPARETPQPENQVVPKQLPQPTKQTVAPEPVNAKQASREVAPQSAEPKQAAPPAVPPIEEIKAAEPAPATSKQASLEVPLPPAKPKLDVRHADRKSGKPRHHVRLARRARNVAKKQEVVQFDLFRILFGLNADQPAKYVQPSSVH
jgi:hypothetical protein